MTSGRPAAKVRGFVKRSLVIGVLWVAGAAWAGEPINVHGALLPSDAVKVGENRYRTSDDWAGTEKTYQKIYPSAQYHWRMIVNQPGIKAMHIPVPGQKNFEGLNIYQANDEIRIYIVPTETKAKKKSDGKAHDAPSGKSH